MATAKKAASSEAASEKVATTTDDLAGKRVPAGALVNVKRDEPTLDPELAKIRDAEAERNNVEIKTERDEPSIDDELVKVRDAEVKAAAEFNKKNS